MSKHGVVGLLLLLPMLAAAGCDDDDETGPAAERFTASLTGAAEVPPRTTPATGTATFTVNGASIDWTVSASNISNVTAAHIHGPAAATANAGVIVALFSGSLTGTRSGTISVADFAANQPVTTMAALLDLLRTGQAYVNVHTNDGVDPTNTGPGDFPGGEIRGQIQRQ